MERSFAAILKEEMQKATEETHQELYKRGLDSAYPLQTEPVPFSWGVRFQFKVSRKYKSEPVVVSTPEPPPMATPIERKPRLWTPHQTIALEQLVRLGAALDTSSTDDEIKRAYRQLARRYHPDMNSDLSEFELRLGTERFHLLQQAYETLLDEPKQEAA